MPPLTDREKTAHLLRRFGLGASEAELDFYASGTYEQAVDKLVNPRTEDIANIPIEAYQNDKGQVNIQAVVASLSTHMLATSHPLRARMMLFWHDHFAISGAKVNTPGVMNDMVDVLKENALGDFRTLLGAISKTPAMIYWLDGQFNVKGKAQENFAREVMELFTLGIGHYTEKDVQEAARAFTGWTYGNLRARPGQATERARGRFIFNERNHDDGPKTVLGKTGNFHGDDILDMLCAEAQTSRYIVAKVLKWFVMPDPDKGLVDRFAASFRASGLDIKKLVRDIALSPEFVSEKAVRKVYKNPVDFVIPGMRALGLGSVVLNRIAQSAEGTAQRAFLAPVAVANQSMQGMGMRLLFPPDVDGWQSGPAWITSATMVERIKFADRLFGQRNPGSRDPRLQYNLYGILSQDPTPAGVVRRLLELFDAPIEGAKRDRLIQICQDQTGGTLTQQNSGPTVNALCRLIFGSPEFQFC